MHDHGLEDELVERLAETNEDGTRAFDPTLEAISAEIDSLSEALRMPPEANPFASEPELANALARASNIAREPSPEPTKSDIPSTGLAEDRQPACLGQYELQEKLGSGGMGTVYRAVHRKLNRTVALKLLPQDRFQSRDAVARFEREMQAVGMLQHPNIVAAHDAGEVDSCHFLVMELVDGEDIGHLLSRTGPLPIAEACEIARQAALGLQHIFENGLVHRDIKPSNLMLASPRQRNAQPTVKILDLGLALLDPNQLGAPRELTSTGQVMGTVDYMAPEQGLDTHSVDIRADLYSLGATLYKLLTGRAPLEDPRYNSMMKRLIALDRDQPPVLTSLRPNCPVELSEFIHRLLSKSPDERPEQPQAVADFLTQYAQGADLRALQQGTAETLKRWIVSSPNVPIVTTTPQSSTQISKPRPTAEEEPSGPPWPARRSLLAAALPVALLLGVLIYVVTDTGQITIEAPDDLKDAVGVSVLRNGAPAVDNWRIEPGPNAHRIRSGTIEVKLAASVDDAFELHPLGDLIVTRGGEVKYRLTRRKLDSAVAKTPSNGSPPKTSSSEIASLPAPIQIDEPPPLEDWLKGRTVLTVAQDGSGQFKTIQAALDSLQPGQVVEVLDHGPYHETIIVRPPEDSGLISRHPKGTMLVQSGPAKNVKDSRGVHRIVGGNGFRLCGFEFTPAASVPVPDYHRLLEIGGFQNAVVEQCFFHGMEGNQYDLMAYGIADQTTCMIRDCRFDWRLGINTVNDAKRCVMGVLRCWFAPTDADVRIEVQGDLGIVVFRNNVIERGQHALLLNGVKLQSLEVANNSFVAGAGIRATHFVPMSNVTIRNNYLAGQIHFNVDVVSQLRDAVKNWRVGTNAYHVAPVDLDSFPKSADDMVVSDENAWTASPTDLDAWRPRTDSPLATRGSGGNQPLFIGALPPGPAPADGDWFTRLRDRWQKEPTK